MILKHLSILNYKNITQADLDFSPRVNCFIGCNGEGKTNVLDAIYFLSLCKSSNCSMDSLVVKHGEEFLSLKANYEMEDGSPEEIHCGIKLGAKKVFRRGNKPYKRLAEHIGFAPIVLISPNDQMLIAGGSDERRKFMDVILSQCSLPYMDSLTRYNKALLQRNVLLKGEEEPEEELLDILEEQMAIEGENIYAMRSAYIEEFKILFQQYYNHISLGKEKVSLVYTSHCQRGPLLDIIRKDRFKDRAVGYSLHGIHKDDLDMYLDGYPMKREGSQGQNKTFLVALKLAQLDFLKHSGNKQTPILLLDDIFDKLDKDRVEQIVKLVSTENFGQIFITDTNRDHLDKILSNLEKDYKLYHVEGGVIQP